MNDGLEAFELAVWAWADNTATAEQLALLDGQPAERLRILERLIDDLDDQLDAARRLPEEERGQVIADFESEIASLQLLLDGLGPDGELIDDHAHEARLQASWEDGSIVVWAGGRIAEPATNAELADRLEALGAPGLGWTLHKGISLPGGRVAEAVAIPIADVLGWVVGIGAGDITTTDADVAPSLEWIGRVAVVAARQVSRGGLVPALRSFPRSEGSKARDWAVRWKPALTRSDEIDLLAEAMPATVTATAPHPARSTTLEVLDAVVHAIATDAIKRLEFPAPPPHVRSASALAETVVTRLDGSTFAAPIAVAAEAAKRLERWAKPVTAANRQRLTVQLDPPDSGNAWFLSVFGPGADGQLLPIELALADKRDTRALADELDRLERVLPALRRAGALRRGQVYLSQDEAWEFMTVTAAGLETAGFEIRVPALSRRKPSPSLRLFVEPSGETVVGAQQLSNVRWSVLFGDVELSAEEIHRLATEARPLVQSHGRWVELDKADLVEAAAALAERASTDRLTGAEILRHAVGLEGNSLGGGVHVDGAGWAAEILEGAKGLKAQPITTPVGFRGTLRDYQAEAVGWLGYLEAVGLGGCLALDMGLGKTPTMLAHVASHAGAGQGVALVIAPPAVVGNWAAEAAKFTPGLQVHVHHGANRLQGAALQRTIATSDVVITTYGTAVRDMDELATVEWRRLVLDEAQAIKNHTNETAQQLRRLKAGTRFALTGTPIENGLGDLWAILDFTNPSLVGDRSSFIAQLSGDGESALRALNGLLIFRRTKAEPAVAAELPELIEEIDHCAMTPEQIGLYQAVLDSLVADTAAQGGEVRHARVLAAITALKQICNHPAAYQDDGRSLEGRSGKLTRLEELMVAVFESDERMLIFTQFASWGEKMADYLSDVFELPIGCYHGGLTRRARDEMIAEFQRGTGPGALVLSLKAGGTGLNLTAANHVVMFDRWWNPATEDQARDRAWRLGQGRTVVSHRLMCPGTIDDSVEEVVHGKRRIANLVLPRSSSLADLSSDQLRMAFGLRDDQLITEDDK